ncbi:MAG: transcriptional regulator [Pedosphaera sp.]|nr:transcriptional regulator [Pedosphaera sp.]
MTFGEKIAEARKAIGLSQKDLAAKIFKEDRESISPQYLNDIEHDRRNPPSADMINQFATVLKVPPEILYFLAGKLTPEDLKKVTTDDQGKIVEAYKAFRRALK